MFRKLKEIYKRTNVSSIRLRQRMRIEVNVLDYIIKEVLSTKCKNRYWKPVAYLSKSLNKIERNYKIHDKKILVVIRGLEN